MLEQAKGFIARIEAGDSSAKSELNWLYATCLMDNDMETYDEIGELHMISLKKLAIC